MKSIIRKADRLLRIKSLERAGGQCEICRSRYVLATHHLLPKSVYPQLRFEMMNSVILCAPCHVMAEDHPDIFLKNLKARERFDERLLFYSENKGRTNPPIRIDYETQLEELRRFQV